MQPQPPSIDDMTPLTFCSTAQLLDELRRRGAGTNRGGYVLCMAKPAEPEDMNYSPDGLQLFFSASASDHPMLMRILGNIQNFTKNEYKKSGLNNLDNT